MMVCEHEKIMKHVGSLKAFLAATFLAAAAVGSLTPIAAPTLAAFSLPAAAAARVVGILEVSGPLLAGILAALLSERRKLSVD